MLLTVGMAFLSSRTQVAMSHVHLPSTQESLACTAHTANQKHSITKPLLHRSELHHCPPEGANVQTVITAVFFNRTSKIAFLFSRERDSIMHYVFPHFSIEVSVSHIQHNDIPGHQWCVPYSALGHTRTLGECPIFSTMTYQDISVCPIFSTRTYQDISVCPIFSTRTYQDISECPIFSTRTYQDISVSHIQH